MRTVIQNTFGGPEVLEIVQAPRPAPQTGEILVRVLASGLNPVDAAVRSGNFPLLGEPPFGLGWDISGVVEEVGADTDTTFAIGDEVYGMPLFPSALNGYADYVVAPAAHFARKPTSLDHVHAAALPLAVLTAWQGLVDAAQVKAGDRVLVHRAAGGVGHLAVQIAKARGAEVIALASAAKHDFVRSLGADEVIDYQAVDFTEKFTDIDVVFDSAGQGERSLSVLRPGCVLVTIVQHRDQDLAAKVEAAGRRFAGIGVRPDAAALEAIAELVQAGRLRPQVAEVFPLAEVVRAHELLDLGQVQGKIVLSV